MADVTTDVTTDDNKGNEADVVDSIQDATQSSESMARVFEGSTHQYIVYFAEDGYKHVNGFILGLFVILIQFILYGNVALEANKLLNSDQVDVKIKFDYCECVNKHWSYDEAYPEMGEEQCNGAVYSSDGYIHIPENLTCSIDYPFTSLIVLGSLLLAMFLQHDYTAIVKLWLFPNPLKTKLFSLIVLAESIMHYIAVPYSRCKVSDQDQGLIPL
eukprot:1095105_1